MPKITTGTTAAKVTSPPLSTNELVMVIIKKKLEDLKVLRRSPDLSNNVKIGQGFTAYNKTYFVLP